MTTVADNEGPSLPGPVIAPRRGLPSGRAAVGALLVAVAAVSAFVLRPIPVPFAPAGSDPIRRGSATVLRIS